MCVDRAFPRGKKRLTTTHQNDLPQLVKTTYHNSSERLTISLWSELPQLSEASYGNSLARPISRHYRPSPKDTFSSRGRSRGREGRGGREKYKERMGIKYLPQGRLTTGEREHAPRHLATAYTVIFFTPTGQKKTAPIAY